MDTHAHVLPLLLVTFLQSPGPTGLSDEVHSFLSLSHGSLAFLLEALLRA